jgi:hypothetical protein
MNNNRGADNGDCRECSGDPSGRPNPKAGVWSHKKWMSYLVVLKIMCGGENNILILFTWNYS